MQDLVMGDKPVRVSDEVRAEIVSLDEDGKGEIAPASREGDGVGFYFGEYHFFLSAAALMETRSEIWRRDLTLTELADLASAVGDGGRIFAMIVEGRLSPAAARSRSAERYCYARGPRGALCCRGLEHDGRHISLAPERVISILSDCGAIADPEQQREFWITAMWD